MTTPIENKLRLASSQAKVAVKVAPTPQPFADAYLFQEAARRLRYAAQNPAGRQHILTDAIIMLNMVLKRAHCLLDVAALETHADRWERMAFPVEVASMRRIIAQHRNLDALPR